MLLLTSLRHTSVTLMRVLNKSCREVEGVGGRKSLPEVVCGGDAVFRGIQCNVRLGLWEQKGPCDRCNQLRVRQGF